MKVKGKLLIVASLVSITTSFSGISNAATSEDIVSLEPREQVNSVNLYSQEIPARNKMISDLMAERAIVLAEEKPGFLMEWNRLGNEMQKLGVEFLSNQEVKMKINNLSNYDRISPYVVIPSQSNIAWTSYRENWVKDGITYEVQHLTAEANSQNSSLKGANGKIIQSDNSFQAGATNLAATVAKDAAKTISLPINIGLTVYDYVKDFVTDSNFSKTTVIENISVNYSYLWYENVDFMYVKKVGQSDNQQIMSFVSSSMAGTLSWNTLSFNYKKSTGAVESAQIGMGSRTYDLRPDNHRNGSAAIAAYLSPYAPKNAYLFSLEMRTIQNKLATTIHGTNPSVPGSIT